MAHLLFHCIFIFLICVVDISGLPTVKDSSPHIPLSFLSRDLQMSHSGDHVTHSGGHVTHGDGHVTHHSDNSPLTLHTNDSHVTQHTDRSHASPYPADDHMTHHAVPHDSVASPDHNLKRELAKLEGAYAKLQLELQSR